jgi:hypothetical protein
MIGLARGEKSSEARGEQSPRASCLLQRPGTSRPRIWTKVDLLWHHGKYQGGTGSYNTDGPAPVKKLKERHEQQE